MKGRQIKRMVSYLNTGQVLRENIALIATAPGIMRTVKKYDAILLEIIARHYQQAEPITHFAAKKKAIKIKLVKKATLLAGLGIVCGYDNNDRLFIGQISYTYTSIYRMEQNTTLAVCVNIYKHLMNRADVLKDYGIRKKDLEELDELIKQFNSIIPSPGCGIISRKVSTKSLGEKLDEAGDMLNGQLDKAIGLYSECTDFCKSYALSRKQQDFIKPKSVLENAIKDFYTAPKLPKQKKKKIAVDIPAYEMVKADLENEAKNNLV